MQLQLKESLLPWQKLGLSYTATGYGAKIPTRFKIYVNNRWYRIYTCIFSNVGTNYIIMQDEHIIVEGVLK